MSLLEDQALNDAKVETTRQRFERMLGERNFSDSACTEIMDTCISKFQELLPSYKVTWDRPASEYPDSFYTVGMLMVVNPAAHDWTLRL